MKECIKGEIYGYKVVEDNDVEVLKLPSEIIKVLKTITISKKGNCSCGKPGIFGKEDGFYNNDTNTQYCEECWRKHCDYMRKEL